MSSASSLSRFLPRALARALAPYHSATHPLSSALSKAQHPEQHPLHGIPVPSSGAGTCPVAPSSSPMGSEARALPAGAAPGSPQSSGAPSATAPAASPIPGLGPGQQFHSSFPGAAVYNVGSSTNIKWHETKVPKEARQGLLRQKGCVIWFTGLSGSGKSTLAYTLEHALLERGHLAYVLDGDNVRHGLNKNLGFSAADREENIRRVGEVAKLFADAGVITIVSFISPYRRDRLAARALVPEGEFFEVYMQIPLSVCEQRDPKGLYKLARAGKIKGFTGIDDPYEEPENAEIVIEVSKDDGVLKAPEAMAQTMLSYLEGKDIVPAPQ